MAEVIVKFPYYKVSVVRWRPVNEGSLQEPDVFITGSWDNGAHNKLSLWKLIKHDSSSGLSSGKYELRLLCETAACSSVTDMKFMKCRDDGELVVTSSDDGSVTVYKCDSGREEKQLVESGPRWSRLHGSGYSRGGKSCTSVSVNCDGSVVTGGEDDKICLLTIECSTPLRSIEDADVGGINAVTFSQSSEVLSVSSVGDLKVWDLRNSSNQPAKIMKLSGDSEGLYCVQCHPTHPHLVVTGRSDGSMCFWDLRHHRQPLSVMVAHTDIVWEAQFHPSNPKHLVTCSNDGCLWHWDATKVVPSTTADDSSISPWLTGDVLANGMDVVNTLPNNQLPINSLDILSKHLIAGADNEAIYVIPDMVVN